MHGYIMIGAPFGRNLLAVFRQLVPSLVVILGTGLPVSCELLISLLNTHRFAFVTGEAPLRTGLLPSPSMAFIDAALKILPSKSMNHSWLSDPSLDRVSRLEPFAVK